VLSFSQNAKKTRFCFFFLFQFHHTTSKRKKKKLKKTNQNKTKQGLEDSRAKIRLYAAELAAVVAELAFYIRATGLDTEAFAKNSSMMSKLPEIEKKISSITTEMIIRAEKLLESMYDQHYRGGKEDEACHFDTALLNDLNSLG
jgi:hypothetical protein